MSQILWIATTFLVLQAVHSYILLTANIEDVQNVAKRFVQAPITGQVGNIVRRAYSVFNTYINNKNPQMRVNKDKDLILAYHPDDDINRRSLNTDEDQNKPGVTISRDESSDSSKNTTNNEETFSALGKSASVYLQKIKKIFENESGETTTVTSRLVS